MTGRNRKEGELVPAMTGRQHTALLALAAGHLKKEAAEKAGVCPQAVSEWLKQPHFQAALESLRGELLSNATLQLRAMTATAISALRETLETGPAPARLRAAMYVLDRMAASQPVRDEIQPDPGSDVSTEKILQAIGFSQ
jgi:hypothetical protein